MTTVDAELDRMRQAFAGDTAAGADCPPAPRLWEAVHGELDPAEAAVVVDHLSSCGACAEAWRLAREIAPEQTDARPVLPFPVKRRASVVWGLLAAAATVLLAVNAWPLLRGASTPATPVATAVTPATSTPAPAPAPVPEQTTAALSPAIEKAPVVLSATRVLVFRNKTSADPFVAAFAAAIEPYKKDDYPEAIARLGALARKYPDADEPPFYLGVSLLMASRPADAVAPLKRAAKGRDAAIAAQARRYLELAAAR